MELMNKKKSVLLNYFDNIFINVFQVEKNNLRVFVFILKVL